MKFPIDGWFYWKEHYPTLLGLKKNPIAVRVTGETDDKVYWKAYCLEERLIEGRIKKEAIVFENMKSFKMKPQTVAVDDRESVFP